MPRGRSRWPGRSRSGRQTRLLDVRPCPAHRIGLRLDANELETRKALRHGDQPAAAAAVDVDDAATPRQVRHGLRERGERLLEEHRHVLGRQPLDRHTVAVGSSRIGVPVRKKSTMRSQSSVATTPWMNWPPRYPTRSRSSSVAASSASTRSRPPSSSARSCASAAHAHRSMASDGRRRRATAPPATCRPRRPAAGPRTARAPGRGTRARSDRTRPGCREGRRTDRKGSRRDCRIGTRDGRAAGAYRTDGPATIRHRPGFWMAMDTDDDLAAHLASDLDRHFETLVYTHQDRLYTIAHRFLGNAHDAEDVTQEALVRAYAALGGYPAAQIRSLRLRPWLATIVLNLCRNRVTRRPGPDPLSLHLAGPDGATIAEPAVDPSATPRPSRSGANPSRLGGARRAVCRPCIAPRSFSGMSTASATPKSPRRSSGPRAPSRRRSIAASRSCEPQTRPPSDASARR